MQMSTMSVSPSEPTDALASTPRYPLMAAGRKRRPTYPRCTALAMVYVYIDEHDVSVQLPATLPLSTTWNERWVTGSAHGCCPDSSQAWMNRPESTCRCWA